MHIFPPPPIIIIFSFSYSRSLLLSLLHLSIGLSLKCMPFFHVFRLISSNNFPQSFIAFMSFLSFFHLCLEIRKSAWLTRYRAKSRATLLYSIDAVSCSPFRVHVHDVTEKSCCLPCVVSICRVVLSYRIQCEQASTGADPGFWRGGGRKLYK